MKEKREFEINVDDYIDLGARLTELGFTEPNAVTILPTNIETADTACDFTFPSESSTVKKLFLTDDMPYCDIVSLSSPQKYLVQKSSNLILPALFISGALIVQNPLLTSVALGIIANYATDFFKLDGDDGCVEFDLVSQGHKGNYKKFSYKGPPQHIEKIDSMVKDFLND